MARDAEHFRQHVRGTCWFAIALSTGVALCTVVAGCGPSLFLAKAHDAESRLEAAKNVGASKFAPLEYYSAEIYFKKSREEAANGQYEVALRLARVAAERAAQAERRSVGRPEVVVP